MKIALLLTGQLRTNDVVKYLHFNNIISKYDTDIFLGIDVDNSLQNAYKNSKYKTEQNDINNIINFFNPINYFILDDFKDEFTNIQNNIKINIEFYKLLFRQYYVVYNVYKLLIKYINSNCIKYDIIIRLRFDQLIWTNETFILHKLENINNQILYNENNKNLINILSKDKKIIFKEILDNSIYLFNYGDFKHYKYANDQFFYHNLSIINIIYNFYHNIPKLIEYCFENKIGNNGAFIECIFYLYLVENNINLQKSNISGIFLREINN